MSAAPSPSPVGPLNPIDDAAAARLVSAQALRELEAAILATPIVPDARARERGAGQTAGRRARGPLLALVAVAAFAAVVLGTTGVFSGAGPGELQVADAAVLRGAVAALAHPPGSIVIESYRSVQRTNPKLVHWAPGYTPPRGIQISRWAQREITETPSGKGPQNEVNLGGPDVARGIEVGEVNGNNELYDPANNTVYVASNYGADITAGSRPGTFVYTLPKTPHAPPQSAAALLNAHMPPRLTITAAQAKALRDGTAEVTVAPDNRQPTANHLRIVPAFRVADDNAAIRSQLTAGKLKVVGPTTVDGRRAIELKAIHGFDEYDVAPGTYDPIRSVLGSAAMLVTTTYTEYRVLPATPANARLLDLAFRHPGARIDRSHADFLAAQGRLLNGS